MNHSTDFIIIIPARLDSSRLPNKVLADIAGKPMIIRVAEQAKKSQAKRVVIATDHEKIQQICLEYNIEVILTSSKHQSGTDRLAEAVSLLSLPDDTIVVNVQGDEPLINPTLINQLAQRLENSNTPMGTLAHPIHHEEEKNNPNIVKVVVDKHHNAIYFSRSLIPFLRNEHAQFTYLRHIGLYAYKVSFLHTYRNLDHSKLEQLESLEQLRVIWHGYKINVLITDHYSSIGVDTEDDLKIVRLQFNQIKT